MGRRNNCRVIYRDITSATGHNRVSPSLLLKTETNQVPKYYVNRPVTEMSTRDRNKNISWEAKLGRCNMWTDSLYSRPYRFHSVKGIAILISTFIYLEFRTKGRGNDSVWYTIVRSLNILLWSVQYLKIDQPVQKHRKENRETNTVLQSARDLVRRKNGIVAKRRLLWNHETAHGQRWLLSSFARKSWVLCDDSQPLGTSACRLVYMWLYPHAFVSVFQVRAFEVLELWHSLHNHAGCFVYARRLSQLTWITNSKCFRGTAMWKVSFAFQRGVDLDVNFKIVCSRVCRVAGHPWGEESLCFWEWTESAAKASDSKAVHVWSCTCQTVLDSHHEHALKTRFAFPLAIRCEWVSSFPFQPLVLCDRILLHMTKLFI
jgi:hypothetical protein